MTYWEGPFRNGLLNYKGLKQIGIHTKRSVPLIFLIKTIKEPFLMSWPNFEGGTIQLMGMYWVHGSVKLSRNQALVITDQMKLTTWVLHLVGCRFSWQICQTNFYIRRIYYIESIPRFIDSIDTVVHCRPSFDYSWNRGTSLFSMPF